MAAFKIATYNVNSLRSRMHIVIPWLKHNRPDIFCMQETKVSDGQFPLEEFEKTGYRVIFKGSKQYNGVAIASLSEPDTFSFGLNDEGPTDEERLIMGSFSGITILNTYVPQGHDKESEQFAYKLKWFQRLRKLLERSSSPKKNLIWCGDLNVAPEAIDVHNPKRLYGHVCFTPEVWEAFALVTSWGLLDVFRKHYPGKPGHYTFFDYRVPDSVERGLGWRVDHILATKPLAAKSTRCSIDMETRLASKPSDHVVLVAEFDI